VLFALGLRHVGAQVARVLARHSGSLPALAKAGADAINRIRGIGPAIAEAVVSFFAEPRNRKLVERLEKLGVNMKEPVTTKGGSLASQTFVITGTLPTLSRAQATALIEGAGGHLTSSVSKKTTAVVAGADPGSKVERARELGVEIINEAELLRRVERGT
jgi:DNA ligase (NAD+)